MITTAREAPSSRQQSAWDRLRLADKFYVRYGRSNPGGSGSVPVIGSSGIFAWTSQPLISHPTIVIGRKGSAGKPWLIKGPSHPSDTTFYLEPREGADVDLDFLYYALSHSQPEASDDVIPSLQRHHLEALELPLPPPREQRAIAAALSKIQGAADTQGKIVATFKELKAATMAKLFRDGTADEPKKETDTRPIPKSWEILSLGKVLELKRGYDLPAYERQPGQIPIVSSSGVSGYHNIPKVLGPGVVTGRYGTLGQVFYLDQDFWPLNTTLYVKDFKGNDPQFIALLIETLNFGDFNDKSAVPGVNRNTLHMEMVALPRLDEQKKMARTITTLAGSISQAEDRFKLLVQLFNTTLNLLMTGKIRLSP